MDNANRAGALKNKWHELKSEVKKWWEKITDDHRRGPPAVFSGEYP